MILIPFLLSFCTVTAWGSYGGIDARYGYGLSAHSVAGKSSLSNFTFLDNAAVPCSGMGVGVFVGYGRRIKAIYLGGEAALSWSDIRGGKSLSVLNGVNSKSLTTVHQDYTFSLAGRAGIPWGKGLVYVKGGAIMARYHFGFSLHSAANGVSVSHSRERWLMHGMTGMGMDMEIMPKICVGIEYTHVLAKSVRIPGGFSHFETVNTVSPQTDFVSIRLLFVL